MRSPEKGQEPGTAAGRIRARLDLFVLGLVVAAHVMAVVSIWGQWERIGIISAMFVGVACINFVIARRFPAERARTAEALRMTFNLLVSMPIYGHFTGWALPVWIHLPLNSLWVGGFIDMWSRVRLMVLLLAVVGFALFEGCPPAVPLTFLVMSVALAGISEARIHLNQLTTNDLEQRNQELAKALAELDLAHRRAREQERLSSLGMLAAGIAHEINNPMSYVKSNIHTLHQEMKEQQELPGPLREYVTEVLPQTLDGIKRVCSIVADLRRFARGDPEALVEYDLNEEVRASLRITRSRVLPECDVVIELGELLPMLGHPRQISQVVVNLLINAAQAMKGRGTVYVSTRPDGEDDVVLTVRDTGVGMAPEVLANLFQPFFTTKPAGEGTGLGLAVVHGIITAHGGRIRVESQPGEGSTFTVRLPRVPPMKFIAAQEMPEQPGASTIHVFQGPLARERREEG
ncbi:sensor histidine kinase [Archangium violaceum]|uniref:sensor histidine kinase n=1 Tax=Archangium violaceum TaxID=83451 RepID=UPI000698323C|nr:ATP-binding protein [Archangium violaceum]